MFRLVLGFLLATGSLAAQLAPELQKSVGEIVRAALEASGFSLSLHIYPISTNIILSNNESSDICVC